jgi:hypothetical protein
MYGLLLLCDVANVNEQGYTVKFLRLSLVSSLSTVKWPSELKGEVQMDS